MNNLLTPASITGHRNTTLLGAVALMLAFAFGVSSTVVPVAAAGQQMLSEDLKAPLLAEIDTPFDVVIPVGAVNAVAFAGLPARPATGCRERIVANPATAFLARAPPVNS